jgi:hypothetical protein
VGLRLPKSSEARFVYSVDYRMQSFIAWHGEVPPEAKRLEDFEARTHGAPWIRRLIGKGLACSYVVGYALGQRWWTLCFERKKRHDSVTPEGAEDWCIEAYDHTGNSWTGHYHFWPAEDRWRDALTILAARTAGDT